MDYSLNMRNHGRDLKSRPRGEARGYRQRLQGLPRSRLRWILAAVGLACLMMGLMIAPESGGGAKQGADTISNGNDTEAPVAFALAYPTALTRGLPDSDLEAMASSPETRRPTSSRPEATDIEAAAQLSADLKRYSVTIAPGDSLSSVFTTLGLTQGELHRILEASDKAALSRLQAGQALELAVDANNVVKEMTLSVDAMHSLHWVHRGDGFLMRRLDAELDRRATTATGNITSSLFLGAKEAGLSDRLIMKMVDIFAWDIDFALDIREGDRFTVIYEELYQDADKVGDGNILAVEFVNRGRNIRAIRFTDGEGRTDYYTPAGRSLRKAFLRTPVKFSRISSRFTQRRWHPVLHRFRAHRGVDYAAPTGTPVKATGDGRVSFAGLQGGYGHTVILQHGEKYTTLYAHLSRYAEGLKPNQRVAQGDVIGYVGMSGLASGPHLHYEFRVNGVHRDPLTVALPKAAPIAPKYRADFLAHAQALLAQLDSLGSVTVASRED